MNLGFPTHNHRVLLIDDNPSIHEDFKKILLSGQRAAALDADAAELFGASVPTSNTVGFQIDSALQGQEGLKCLQEAVARGTPYALAFVDMRMPPGWDGIETVSRLWEVSPDLQVVICTAFSDYSYEEVAEHLGQSDNLVILKKPFDNIEVLQLAHALTCKWTLAQQARARMAELDQMVAARTHQLEATNEQLRGEIQERTRAQDALRFSEKRLIEAFKATPLPFAIVTLANDNFVDVNEPFQQLAHLAHEQILGRTPTDLDLWVEPGTQERIREQVKANRAMHGFECHFRPHQGNPCEVLVSAQIFELEKQEHVLLIIEDISERVRLETRIRQSQKMEAVGQLAAGVAHDFNNLLTIIQGHSELGLTFADLPPRLSTILSEISKASHRAAALTRQLLAFSRKQVFQPRTIDLGEQVTDTCKMIRRLIGEQIEFSLAITAPKPLLVQADPIGVEQVMLNLAVNARDAMPSGGRLLVHLELASIPAAHAVQNPEAREGAFICLSVSDTGCGMDTTTLSRIFEPFFTTKSLGSGTGLGLATVYGIAKQLGGWIEVSSALAKGSTFKVYLPQSQDCAPASGDTTHLFHRALHNEGVLVVEDEACLREFVKVVLEQNGYRVFSAADGTEAQQVWLKHRTEIQLLLTDIVMPGGLSGLELARHLQTEEPGLGVVLSSGYSIELVRQGLPSAAQDVEFLAKPYRPQKLTSAVRACLERCQKRKQAA